MGSQQRRQTANEQTQNTKLKLKTEWDEDLWGTRREVIPFQRIPTMIGPHCVLHAQTQLKWKVAFRCHCNEQFHIICMPGRWKLASCKCIIEWILYNSLFDHLVNTMARHWFLAYLTILAVKYSLWTDRQWSPVSCGRINFSAFEIKRERAHRFNDM